MTVSWRTYMRLWLNTVIKLELYYKFYVSTKVIIMYKYSVHSVLLTEVTIADHPGKSKCSRALSEWVNINTAKILQSTEQALVVGLLKAPTLTSAVCRLCCRRSYVQGARPPFSADNAPCVWIQDALIQSFILLSQRCIVTNWRRWSGQRCYVQVRILDRFGAQSVRALPLTDTPCISTFQRNWRKIFQLFGHLLNSQGQSVSPDISKVRRNWMFCAKDLMARI